MRGISILVVAALLGALSPGCSGQPTDQKSDEPIATQESTLIGGTSVPHPEIGKFDSPASQDCTAVLLAPKLIGIALLCIASFSNHATIDCQNGPQGVIGQITDPALANATFGTQVVHPTQYITLGSLSLCAGNIAFAVLDNAVTGVTTTPQILWDSVPALNEPVTACGTGEVDVACTQATEVQCGNGSVLLPNGGLYAGTNSQIPTGNGVSSAPMCGGDAGGALFDKNGALIGILNAYIQDDLSKVPTVTTPCIACQGAHSEYAILSTYQDLVLRAYATNNISPWRAGHPKPVDVGGECSDSIDCNSQLCIGLGSGHVCSEYCNSSACPAGSVCTAVDSRSVCLPQVSPRPASCTIENGHASPLKGESSESRGAWIFVIVLAAAVVKMRKRARIT